MRHYDFELMRAAYRPEGAIIFQTAALFLRKWHGDILLDSGSLDGSSIPLRGGMTRLEDGETPSEGDKLLSVGGVMPLMGTFLPVGSNMSSEGGTLPSADGTMAYFQIGQYSLVGGIFHSQGSMAPSEDFVVPPRGGTTHPGGGSIIS